MLTCNLSEIVHDIWLQQFGNKGTCLFITMFDDYLWTFKQSSLYYVILQGGASRTDLNKNELCLHRASQFKDPIKIVVVVATYTSSSSFFARISHLDGEEVFG
jgi:hypothetical protein